MILFFRRKFFYDKRKKDLANSKLNQVSHHTLEYVRVDMTLSWL